MQQGGLELRHPGNAGTASRACGYGIITQRAIRRGSFSSVKELIAKIEQFVLASNKTKEPFTWTVTTDSILEKLQRLCPQISGT